MTSYIVTIHDHPFILTAPAQEQLRKDVVSAVGAGGGFVDFAHEEGTAAAFVSASTAVLIRAVPEVTSTDQPAEPRNLGSPPGASERRGPAPVVRLRTDS